MPLFDDLVRRAIGARENAKPSSHDLERVAALADILRAANAGEVSIRRCAWCDRFQVGDEWLDLEAVGDGQHRIVELLKATSLLDRATHGVCEDCLRSELDRSEAVRRGRSAE